MESPPKYLENHDFLSAISPIYSFICETSYESDFADYRDLFHVYLVYNLAYVLDDSENAEYFLGGDEAGFFSELKGVMEREVRGRKLRKACQRESFGKRLCELVESENRAEELLGEAALPVWDYVKDRLYEQVFGGEFCFYYYCLKDIFFNFRRYRRRRALLGQDPNDPEVLAKKAKNREAIKRWYEEHKEERREYERLRYHKLKERRRGKSAG